MCFPDPSILEANLTAAVCATQTFHVNFCGRGAVSLTYRKDALLLTSTMDTNKPAALRRRPFGSPYILFSARSTVFFFLLSYREKSLLASLSGASPWENHGRRPLLGKLPFVRLPVHDCYANPSQAQSF